MDETPPVGLQELLRGGQIGPAVVVPAGRGGAFIVVEVLLRDLLPWEQHVHPHEGPGAHPALAHGLRLLELHPDLAEAAGAVGGVAQEAGYALNPGDVLQVSVWKETELTRDVLVRPDGRISFPLVGDIAAAGTTPEAVQGAIAERLEKYIPDPVVTVSLAAANGNKIYVLGKVARPGEYMMVRPLDVMQALAMAGGLNTFASENKIRILRRDASGKLVFIDEVHTPDSSRYWYADDYEARVAAGQEPRSLDKEYVRRWLADQGYGGDGPPPELTAEVRIEAARRYIAAYELVTGKVFVADDSAPLARIEAGHLRWPAIRVDPGAS